MVMTSSASMASSGPHEPSGEMVDIWDGPTLRFDTQAEAHVLCSREFFVDGVDTSVQLNLGTIVKGSTDRTSGVGTATITLATGQTITLRNAHLYERGTSNVVATSRLPAHVTVDIKSQCLAIADTEGVVQGVLPFDAGYCNLRIDPGTTGYFGTRHPEARSAILITGIDPVGGAFGGITGPPQSRTGMREMNLDDLGRLWAMRTGLGVRALKALPDCTNAPKSLASLPDAPRSDHVRMRSTMDVIPHGATDTDFDRWIFFDLQGPFTPSVHAGHRYAVNFVCVEMVPSHDGRAFRRTRRVLWHIDFLQTKDKFPDALETFLDSGDYKGWQLATDNEAVLNQAKVKQMVKAHRMPPMRNSCEYHPWQNAHAERPWRTLSATTREFILRGLGEDTLADGVDPAAYWTYAAAQCAQVHNAIASGEHGASGRITTGTTGRITHLRTLFCTAYVKTPARFRGGKHAPQAEMGVHLGWSTSKPGYRIEILEGPRAGRVVTSAQVKFREAAFPLHPDGPRMPGGDLLYDDIDDTPAPGDDRSYLEIDADDDDNGAPIQGGRGSGDDGDDDDYEDIDDDDYSASGASVTSGVGVGGDDLGASGRRHTRSQGDVGHFTDVHNRLDRGRKAGTIGIMYTNCADGKPAEVPDPAPPTGVAPKHFSKIKDIPNVEERNAWYKEHFSENDGLFEYPDVMRMMPLPPDVSVSDLMRLMTLYVIKADGRFKARTVLAPTKEDIERLSADLGPTFSPTARLTTLRILCALAPHANMVIQGGDVRQAYAQGRPMPEGQRVLSDLPLGYNRYYNGVRYCVKVGALYGHPISGRNWFFTLRDDHIEAGYPQSDWDPCLFLIERNGEKLFILIYVDDVLTFCTKGSKLRDEWKEWFSSRYIWTDFGTDLHPFVGILIRHIDDVITLDMIDYTLACAAEAFPGGIHLEGRYSTPAATDLATVVQQTATTRDTSCAGTPIGKRFRRIVMQLLYLATSARPDIALAVGLLTRVQAWPSPDLLKRAERILIYAAATAKTVILTYRKGTDADVSLAWAPKVVVEGASDADWALAHSTSAYIFKLCGAAISWAMKKQESIALHTMEAEIHAGSLAACDAVFIRGITEEVGYKQTQPTVLRMDNTSGISLANDPMFHAKAKHINRRDLYIRELVERKVIRTEYIASGDNPADMLTKPLDKQLFQKHRATIMGAT